MCRLCTQDGNKKRHPGRPVKVGPQQRKERAYKSSRRWLEKNPERAKFLQRRGWLSRYGLTIEQYDLMLEEQGGHCAICPTTPEKNGNNLSVDHDHSCCPPGRGCRDCVRGLLCKVCNRDMGRIDKYREGFLAYLGVST